MMILGLILLACLVLLYALGGWSSILGALAGGLIVAVPYVLIMLWRTR